MSEIKDGGPAFPVPETVVDSDKVHQPDSPGMTLRDYFAAKAMQAFITRNVEMDVEDEHYDRLVSQWAYETADAMLRARGAA